MRINTCRTVAIAAAVLWLPSGVSAQPRYDLLLKGGHVIDPRNQISAVRDVAIADGKVALVGTNINPSEAAKTLDVSGLYVTPGLVDIHVHVYAGTGERGSYAGDNSVYPDGFTFRSGVTTVADAGCAGWRNFEDFKQRIIDRSKTRVLAFLNIVGNGMRGGKYEQDLSDMDAEATAKAAEANGEFVIGVKCAHYSGLRNEIDDAGRPGPGLIEGRKRGVIFDVGHGGGSFSWRVATPLTRAGF